MRYSFFRRRLCDDTVTYLSAPHSKLTSTSTSLLHSFLLAEFAAVRFADVAVVPFETDFEAEDGAKRETVRLPCGVHIQNQHFILVL